MTAPNAPAPFDENVIDLDRARATRREAKGAPTPIRLGGETIAALPVELPLDVFEPVKLLDLDIALLIRKAVDMQQASDRDQAMAATSLLIDLLVARPTLPSELIDAIVESGRRLLNSEEYPEGYNKFVAARPTREDVAEFAKGVFRQYGVGLGEALQSSDSSTSGEGTSKQTSLTTTPGSTSGASGKTRTRKASSASDG
jgi:hypothetical protein